VLRRRVSALHVGTGEGPRERRLCQNSAHSPATLLMADLAATSCSQIK